MSIQVFTTPSCVQCNATKRWLNSRDIEFETVDVTEDPDAHARVTALGYTQAPVVVVDDTTHWSGFDPGSLEQAALQKGYSV